MLANGRELQGIQGNNKNYILFVLLKQNQSIEKCNSIQGRQNDPAGHSFHLLQRDGQVRQRGFAHRFLPRLQARRDCCQALERRGRVRRLAARVHARRDGGVHLQQEEPGQVPRRLSVRRVQTLAVVDQPDNERARQAPHAAVRSHLERLHAHRQAVHDELSSPRRQRSDDDDDHHHHHCRVNQRGGRVGQVRGQAGAAREHGRAEEAGVVARRRANAAAHGARRERLDPLQRRARTQPLSGREHAGRDHSLLDRSVSSSRAADVLSGEEGR